MADKTQQSDARIVHAPGPIACAHCRLPVPLSRRDACATEQFCCIGCRISHRFVSKSASSADGESIASGLNPLLLRLGAGIFLTLNIMAFGDYFYSREAYRPQVPPHELQQYTMLTDLFAYLLMLLCTIVVVTLGIPLAREAMPWLFGEHRSDISQRRILPRIDANTLILIGVAAAFALSVIHTLRGRGGLYFDTAAMILVLVTLGAYLEAKAKVRATEAADAFFAALPRRAWVERDNHIIELRADDVRVGDRVRVRPGEAAPVDGVVLDGASQVNESSLTGEFQPRAVSPGDRVFAASSNLDGLLWISATAVGDERVVASMRHLLELARAKRPRVQRVADAASAVFVPAVIALALAVFAFHVWRSDPTRGLFDALSVLLISCPCALGLSAPLATWAALGRAARRGILVGSAESLEKAAAIRRVLFDKTGTLTTPRPRLECVITQAGLSANDAVALAASVESSSIHPIAAAILDEARRRGLMPAPATSSRLLPGLGVEAVVAGRTLSVVNRPPHDADTPLDDECLHAFLREGERLLAEFVLAEQPRVDATQAIARLRSLGIEVEILTGDRSGPARRLARELGVAVTAELLPAGKLDAIDARRRTSDRTGAIAIVGDGINDAPALAAADIGIAIGAAADITRQAGNVHLLGDRLMRVPELVELSRHTMRRIRLNLAWAFGYNLIGITLAATGRLNPIFAASAMIVSSLVIVISSRNAGRLGDAPVSSTHDAPDTPRPETPAPPDAEPAALAGGRA